MRELFGFICFAVIVWGGFFIFYKAASYEVKSGRPFGWLFISWVVLIALVTGVAWGYSA